MSLLVPISPAELWRNINIFIIIIILSFRQLYIKSEGAKLHFIESIICHILVEFLQLLDFI